MKLLKPSVVILYSSVYSKIFVIFFQLKSIINKNDCNNYFLETEINKVQHSFIAISCTKLVRFKNLTISPD